MSVCVHVKNPFLAVLRVVSLNVHAKTAPAGSNPFEDEDDEDEEEEELEVVAKQQTTVNHIIANKEDMKTLVNRSRRCSPTSFLPFFLFLWFEEPPFSLLCLYYFAPFFLETLPPLRL